MEMNIGKEEIWKDITGYDGKYKISNFGNVLSLDWRGTKKPKILKKTKKSNGYLTVSLATEDSYKMVYIHRLVASAFLPKIEGKDFVNHKDCNKANNNVDNLEWCTQKENSIHASINHRLWDRKGKPLVYTNKRVKMINKITNETIKIFADVMEARKYIGDGDRHSSHIYSCLTGERKSHKGYKWLWE